MCFKQTNLSTLYTEIIANFMHCGVSEVQSLHSTAFVVAGHFDHASCSIIVKALLNLLRWDALLHHSAQCLAIDQSQLLST